VQVFTVYLLCIYYVFTMYLLCIYYVFTMYLLCIYYVFTMYSSRCGVVLRGGFDLFNISFWCLAAATVAYVG